MSTYAIGDVQGCFATLQNLLRQIQFDPKKDSVWLVGDLVNRGPQSLDVLRWAKQLGSRAVVVLGNHDVFLLALARGFAKQKPGDTLNEVLKAPDCEELIGWLAAQPLLVRHKHWVMVHAGLLPMWTIDTAASLARTTENLLRGNDFGRLFSLTSQIDTWEGPQQDPLKQSAAVLNALTRMRVCEAHGRMHLKFNGTPDACPPATTPWYEAPLRRSQNATIICGHWAALGLHITPNMYALDSGCVWGQQLTAICLEDGHVFSEPTAPGDQASSAAEN